MDEIPGDEGWAAAGRWPDRRRVGVPCEPGLALGLFDAVLDPRLRGVLPRIRAADVVAIGPRD